MWGKKVVKGSDFFVVMCSKVFEAACGGWHGGDELDLSLWGKFRLLFRGDESDLSLWEDFREGGLDLPFWLDFRLSLREGDLGLLWNFRLPFRGFVG